MRKVFKAISTIVLVLVAFVVILIAQDYMRFLSETREGDQELEYLCTTINDEKTKIEEGC